MIRQKMLRVAASVAILLSAVVGVSAPASAHNDSGAPWYPSGCNWSVEYQEGHHPYGVSWHYWSWIEQRTFHTGWSGYTDGTRIERAYAQQGYECGGLDRPISNPYWYSLNGTWVLWQDFANGFIYDRNGQIVIGYW